MIMMCNARVTNKERGQVGLVLHYLRDANLPPNGGNPFFLAPNY